MPKPTDKPPRQPNRNKGPNDFIKYAGLGFQMIAVILLFTFGGRKLDQYLQLSFPAFTIIFLLLSLALAMYSAIRNFLPPKK